MNSYLVQKYGAKLAVQSVEVHIGDLSGKYYLPDDSVLRDKKVVAFFTEENANDDKFSPSGRPLVGPVGMRSARLTLVHVNNKLVDSLPLDQFTVQTADRAVCPFEMDCLTPSKCYIEVASPTAVAGKVAVGESLMLYFVYIDN